MPHRPLVVTILVLVYGLIGCTGGGETDKPNTVPVSGTVTLDGKPIAGATLAFIPTTPDRHGAAGSTDAEGKYTLFVGDTPGAQPGSYKVTIEYYTKRDGTPVPMTPETDIQMMGDVTQSLPLKYSDPEQTELKADIPEGGTESADFKLTK